MWFAFLRSVVLPPGAWLLQRWLRSCRCSVDGDREVEMALNGDRVIVAVLHGSMLHLLALVLARRLSERRRLCVLLSSSLDGRLLAKGLRRFEIDHVFGAAREEGERGGREVIRRVRDRQMAILAVDGPTGPAGIVKPGIGLLARAAAADVFTVHTTARHGFRFPSWDRCWVPWPFGEIRFTIRHLPPPAKQQTSGFAVQVQEYLTGTHDVRCAGGVPGSTPSSADAPRTTARGDAR